MSRTLIPVLAFLMTACPGSDTVDAPELPANVACSVALSGATTGNLTCTQALSVWASSNNTGSVSINITGSSPTVTSAISFSGEPHTGTFKNTDANALGAVTVTGAGGVWVASIGGNNATSGSYTLVLSSVSAATTTSTGKSYTVHGTLDATLPPIVGTGTSVTFHATF
jgi:hypothetical protein